MHNIWPIIFLRFGKFPLQICESCGATYDVTTNHLDRCKAHQII